MHLDRWEPGWMTMYASAFIPVRASRKSPMRSSATEPRATTEFMWRIFWCQVLRVIEAGAVGCLCSDDDLERGEGARCFPPRGGERR